MHHLVFLKNTCDSMRFLIDRGIDMTIKDHRWNSTAQGWADFCYHSGTSGLRRTQWRISLDANS